jgi:hypothetical protein
MIDIYSRSRAPGEGSQIVAIVGVESDLPSDAPAVCVAVASGEAASGSVVTASDPVTANVNWQTFPSQVQTAGAAPRGWTPLVTLGEHVIVAARSEPTRQIWVGFDSSAWSATPDFVVFWANVFNWLGQGEEHFAAYPLAAYDPAWKPVETVEAEPGMWPGIYQTDEGTLRAYNPPATMHSPIAKTTPQLGERLIAAQGIGNGGYDLSPVVLIAALGCLVVAAGTWKRVAPSGKGLVR